MAPPAEERPPAIVVDGVDEVFRLYAERPPGLKERLFRFKRARFTEFKALNGVSVRIAHGESVALVGHNGSGKSTLLKVMARILPPDRGRVDVDGTVATLLELGAGFSPELTGRENMYLNGSILGLSRAEVDRSFDAIVDFAGVRDFLDTPVKNYSSGMYVRLGFAVAVHVDPDILLVDEVLAVGDATFQEKSLARMRSFKERGKTVVLVSHDLGAVADLCDRVVVLDHGRVVFDGPAAQGLQHYERLVAGGRQEPAALPVQEEETEPDGDRRAAVRDVVLALDGPDGTLEVRAGDPVPKVPPGTHGRLVVEVEARDELIGLGGLSVGFAVRRPDLPSPVYATRTSYRVTYVAPPPPGATLRVAFDLALHVLTGTYLVDVDVGNAEDGTLHHAVEDAVRVVVEGAPHDQGVSPLDVRVAVDNPDGVWPPESVPPPVEEGGPAVHPSPLWRPGEAPPARRGGGRGAAAPAAAR